VDEINFKIQRSKFQIHNKPTGVDHQRAFPMVPLSG
jgi:hypothetical protein